MIIRYAKIALVSSIGFFLTLVVYNNIFDYHSNELFVQHVLSMDTTFPGNKGMWRACPNPTIQTIFYWSIIGWEMLTMALCWIGAFRLYKKISAPAAEFHATKGIAILGLSLSLLQWMVAFISVGGEWFLMWQSKI